MNNNLSRRSFLRKSTLALAGITIVPRHVLGGKNFIAANDQISLGIIGCGAQGKGLANEFAKRTNLIAACDVDSRKVKAMEERVLKTTKEKRGIDYKGFKTYHDYKDLLSRKDIDGVIIATPDHWHALITIDACKAGKDIYVEKPLTHGIEEGRMMQQAVEKYNRVLQVGNMQRSWRNFRYACELVRNKYIGDIKEVHVAVGGPYRPYDLPAQPLLKELDWDRWIGPSPMVHYNQELAPPLEVGGFPNWRWYKEFAGGMVCDWGAHMFDIAQWALNMDDSAPIEYYPADGKEFKHVTMKYANGITMTHEPAGIRKKDGNSVRFVGTDGVIDISRSFLDTIPANLANIELKDTDTRLYKSEDHYSDFLQAMESRKQPISTVEIGHRTASLCHIVNFVYEFNRPIRWDPKLEQFIGDDELNKRIHLNYRKGYKLEL